MNDRIRELQAALDAATHMKANAIPPSEEARQSQVLEQLTKFSGLAEAVLKMCIDMEQRLKPLLRAAEDRDENTVPAVDLILVPLAARLHDGNHLLSAALTVLDSIGQRLEL